MTSRPGPTPKGERTRRQILDGAIRVVGDQGVNAVTHRAVAKDAGVSLSTTTYYFTSLDDLLTQAFARLVEQMDSSVVEAVEAFRQAATASNVTIESPIAEREALRGQLVEVVMSYLTRADVEWRAMLRAELRFFFEATHIDSLNDLLRQRRTDVANDLAVLPEMVKSDNAQLDAEMLYDMLLLAEYDMLASGPAMSREENVARFTRFFGWILRI